MWRIITLLALLNSCASDESQLEASAADSAADVVPDTPTGPDAVSTPEGCAAIGAACRAVQRGCVGEGAEAQCELCPLGEAPEGESAVCTPIQGELLEAKRYPTQ